MKIKVQFILLILLVSCSYTSNEIEALETVIVSYESKYIYLEPVDPLYNAGFVFYPGGLVEADAYINTLLPIADMGLPVFILKATADLAIFNVQRAGKVVKEYPEIDSWIVGGHSLGGVVAVKSVLQDTALFDGLVLFAAYPAENDNLSMWGGAAISITAENDSLTTRDEVEATRNLLPAAILLDRIEDFPEDATYGSTIFYEIEGGNHAQFGDYGNQKDDGEASIEIDQQHAIIEEVLTRFFTLNFE